MMPIITQQDPSDYNWWCISRNPGAITLIEQNLDKVNWNGIALNHAASHLIVQYHHKITERKYLYCDSSLFTLVDTELSHLKW